MNDAPLPLPDLDGQVPFAGILVDAYVEAYGVSRAECFRRIADVTGNSVNSLSLRYHQRGNFVWRMSLA